MKRNLTPAQARLPIWEKAKKERRKNRFIRLFILLLLILVVVNLSLRLPAIIKNIKDPFDRFPGEDLKTAKLDYSFRLNILLISYKSNNLEEAAIATYDPADKRLKIVSFDLKNNPKLKNKINTLFIEGGVGELQKYISGALAVPIDRYAAFENKEVNFNYEEIAKIKKSLNSPLFIFKLPGSWGVLKKILKTNLSLPEIWSLFLKVKSANFENSDFVSLEKVTEYDLQSEEVASFLGNLFLDKEILEEGASLSIQNSSGEAGLGAILANYLTHIGANVVFREATNEVEKKSVLIVKNSKSKVEKRLQTIITFQKKGLKKEDFPGDILIILGEEAIEELTLP